ncbi:MAG: hypothetical protein JW731_07430 [Bacteroidales bacterium]|nr:hypothetical protein [Bacteroidales bacterium]
MKLFLFFFATILFFESSSQDSFYSNIQFGNFNIGFCDTIIYNDDLTYDQFGYQGPLPIFIQVWHPVILNSSGSFLTYGDFRKRTVPVQLISAYNELSAQTDSSFIAYNIREAYPTYEEIDYGTYTYQDVLNEVKKIPGRSRYAVINNKSDFPIIIYHHGAQGVQEENFIMAEYFSSRGFIFVSANYHLPYEGMVYGLYESISNNTSSEKAVIEFAKSLTSNEHLFYIGHSWGAQAGWCFLYEEGRADAFVSMETTIEFKTGTNEIKDKWPFVFDVVQSQQKAYSLPVLMFANTRDDKPFWFFENSGRKEMIFASAREDFAHESYTSVYLMRYFLRDRFPQPDTGVMKSQVALYLEHLKLIDSFFDSVINEKPFIAESFKDCFFLNTSNKTE